MPVNAVSKLSKDGGVYIRTEGITESNAVDMVGFTKITNVESIDSNITKDSTEFTTLYSDFKENVSGMKELKISFEALKTKIPADIANYLILSESMIADTIIGVAVFDGPIAEEGVDAIFANVVVTSLNDKHGKGDNIKLSCEFTVAVTAIKPYAYKVPAV